ncbi:MAG: zinc ribbon domain-containing protein [Promethearchaeota archaeon]|nr:MAG: zinc ribbon domain-containing protein [Candidatus Lokiarchaeota archaeon]
MFSFVGSHPITPGMMNHSFLTSYLLLNVLGGHLTDYTKSSYTVVLNATRTVRPYDLLFFDQVGWWNLMEWDLSDVDDGTHDPGGDGHAGADWYDRSYEEESTYADNQDFTASLPLCMPTIEPWEWENHWEIGTLARCPALDLTSVTINLQITQDLKQRAMASGTGRIWVRLELHTFTGSWLNTTVSLDLSLFEGPSQTYRLEYNLSDCRLWDGKAFKTDQERYQQAIISAPYLVVEVYDADPSRYYRETFSKQFVAHGDLQQGYYTFYQALIQDERQRLAFRQDHLLDASLYGMDARPDQRYLEEYQRKIAGYSAWVTEQNRKAQEWNAEKVFRVIFTVGTLILSCIWAYYSGGWPAYAGIILSVDQLQAMFTQRSMFSTVVSTFAVPIAASSCGWTAEQTENAFQRFNVWTPFTFTQDTTSKYLNSLWSTFFVLAFTGALFQLIKAVGNATPPPKGDLSLHTPLERAVVEAPFLACPACGYQNAPQDLFCRRCGVLLKMG